jgi:hypothetical protein
MADISELRTRVGSLRTRLLEIYEHDWRVSYLAFTSDTALEARQVIDDLLARVVELEAALTTIREHYTGDNSAFAGSVARTVLNKEPDNG